MAKVEIFRYVEGTKMPVVEAMAKTEEAQRGVTGVALAAGMRSEATLAAHRYSGASQIDVIKLPTDALIVLTDANDTRYTRARTGRSAYNIEFGTRRSAGVGALAAAFRGMKLSSGGGKRTRRRRKKMA